ncbi:MAG: UDP-N-acetylmuramate--L-alanine ligase [Caldithrix sp.]|nr:UDP-N-acetylmuramate--L-alanine ligase [Caldithrix sp.]
MFEQKKKFHFIGIGGIGMSGIAEILLAEGHLVSGSDRQQSEITDYLQSKGAEIYIGQDRTHVHAVDYCVFSSAVSPDNPEIQAAKEKGIPLVRRAEMLAQLVNPKFNISVAGTHGKTTTSSMLGNVLIDAGFDPTIIVGGRLQKLKTNARLGKSDYILCEADEYDRSFLTLYPRIAIITSIEADHLDIYKDIDDLKHTFNRFANQVPYNGLIACCWDDPNIREILNNFYPSCYTYGLEPGARFRAENIKFKETHTRFDVIETDHFLGSIELKSSGSHNVRNALGVVAVSSALDIPFDTVARSLNRFEGVQRRFEIKGFFNDVMIVDDYAHHPTEVDTTIAAAKSGWDRRLVAIFQPHLFSRTKDFYKEFAEALKKADLVIVSGIYPAREQPIEGVSGEMITNHLKYLGHGHSYFVENRHDIPDFLNGKTETGDMVLTMGAGNIWEIIEPIIKKIKA